MNLCLYPTRLESVELEGEKGQLKNGEEFQRNPHNAKRMSFVVTMQLLFKVFHYLQPQTQKYSLINNEFNALHCNFT